MEKDKCFTELQALVLNLLSLSAGKKGLALVHVDGKDATFRETSNNANSRTLAIDFNKDARMIEIIGTQASQQQ